MIFLPLNKEPISIKTLKTIFVNNFKQLVMKINEKFKLNYKKIKHFNLSYVTICHLNCELKLSKNNLCPHDSY